MSFSLCIAFTYCTDDLVQGNDEGILEFESKGDTRLCLYFYKLKNPIQIQRKQLDVRQFDRVAQQSMQRKNQFFLKRFSLQGSITL